MDLESAIVQLNRFITQRLQVLSCQLLQEVLTTWSLTII